VVVVVVVMAMVVVVVFVVVGVAGLWWLRLMWVVGGLWLGGCGCG
jgi:hypothetical protein